MSTHVLDVSGARPLTTTVNDPARTAAQTSAKAGDDVRFQVGGAREVRIGIPAGAKIERRRKISRSARHEDGKLVRDENGDVIYDEVQSDSLYLVCQGVSVFARSSLVVEPAEGEPTYEPTPHTTIFVKRLGNELDLSESGDLLEERDIREFLPPLDEETLAKIPVPLTNG